MTDVMAAAPQVRVIEQIPETHATLNIPWQGQNGDLNEPIPKDASDEMVKGIATEAVRGGMVPGIDQDPEASFENFVVDRYPETADKPYARLFTRPKVPFGFDK